MFAFVAANLIWLLPLVVAAAVASAAGLLPMFRPWIRDLRPAHRIALTGLTKGAATILAGIARTTPTTLDDDIAKLLMMVSDELGRSMTEKEAETVKRTALALHVDPSRIQMTLSPGNVTDVLATPVKDLLKRLPESQRKGVVR